MKRVLKFLPAGPNKFNVTIDSSLMTLIEDKLKERWKAQVGILGSDVERQNLIRVKYGEKSKAWTGEKSPLTNAKIGTIHEFGIFKLHIPARSFLRMPLNLHLFDAIKQGSGKLGEAVKEGDMGKFYALIGIYAEKVVQEAFAAHGPGWAPLKPQTIARKGSSAQLIDSGQLRKSITSRAVKI
jgi:phage gpG-like protein